MAEAAARAVEDNEEISSSISAKEAEEEDPEEVSISLSCPSEA